MKQTREASLKTMERRHPLSVPAQWVGAYSVSAASDAWALRPGNAFSYQAEGREAEGRGRRNAKIQ